MVLYSIILPVYNQRQNLPLIIYLIYQISVSKKIEIQVIIVQDNSPDGTGQIAFQLKKHFKDFTIILSRKQKLGLGSAYRDGLKQCQGDFIILMDADLSHHPKYIPIMIEKQIQTDSDIVTGSRYINGGGVQGWTFFRKLTSRTANFITNFILQSKSSDYTGSFRLYKKKVLQQLMAKNTAKGYSFQMQMIVLAQRQKMKITQIPIIFVDRVYGKSKLGSNEIILYLKTTMELFFSY